MAGIEGGRPHFERTPPEQHTSQGEGGNGAPRLTPNLNERAKPPPKGSAQGERHSTSVQLPSMIMEDLKEKLLDMGYDMEQKLRRHLTMALWCAAANGYTKTAKVLLDRGDDPSADRLIARTYAFENGHMETVRMLEETPLKKRAKRELDFQSHLPSNIL